MKYQQLVLGIAIGLIVSYAALRIVHHVQRVGFGAATTIALGQPAQADPQQKTVNELQFSSIQLTAHAKLGQVTISYDFVPSNGSHNATMQLFLLINGTWTEFTPTDDNGTIVFQLFKDLDNTGTFVIDLPKGHYDAYRIILFDAPDGKNPDFAHALWDSAKEKNPALPKLDLTVLSSLAPLNGPVLAYPPNPLEQDEGNGLSTVTIPGLVKYPKSYTVDGGGFWVMAKGNGGFSQVWAGANDAVEGPVEEDPYLQIPVSFVLKDLKPGVWNVQFGLFKQSFGDPIEWVYPGMDFEVGGSSWEFRAPERRIPPRLKVAGNRFELLSGQPYNFYADDPGGRAAAQFLRGGNYGNAISWTVQPALNTPGFFTLLAGAGCHYIRFNYNPDRYLAERVYQDSVDQVIQNIWAAGLYPVIAPQDLPTGDTLEQRIEKGDHLMKMIAAKYAGKSVWIEVCNEPQEFESWADWKPVAERYVKTIRSIDPEAFTIVPFEYYSKDSRGAAASPITDVHVDLYDGHAYVEPSQIAALFGPAIKAGLPVIVGEYGSSDPVYLHKMDVSLQALSPPPVAVSPWSFTVKGQDSIPLIEDGSTASLVMTPAGQAIENDFGAWDNGRKVQ